jgi:signal transduction histidine kinase
MKQRVTSFNGRFSIDSTIGRGTKIEIRIPLEARE